MFRKSPFLVIAWMTYWEARHNKVLYIAAGFAAAIILFSLFMGEVSLYQNEKVVKDIGLASISLLGVFVAIFLGVTGLYKDLERRTIYTIVSKPIDRYQVVAGKLLGMCLVIISVVVTMTIFLYLVTAYSEQRVDWSLIPAIFLIIVELLVVAGLAIFFSSFSSPFLSGLFTFGIFLVGRISNELWQFGSRSKNEIFKGMARFVQQTLDFEAFNLRAQVVHKFPVYAEDVWWPVLYGIILITVLYLASVLAFHRRDFK